jgi:hypothetical protein
MQTTTVREDRINEGLGQVKAPTRSPEHPLNKVSNLLSRKNDSG